MNENLGKPKPQITKSPIAKEAKEVMVRRVIGSDDLISLRLGEELKTVGAVTIKSAIELIRQLREIVGNME